MTNTFTVLIHWACLLANWSNQLYSVLNISHWRKKATIAWIQIQIVGTVKSINTECHRKIARFLCSFEEYWLPNVQPESYFYLISDMFQFSYSGHARALSSVKKSTPERILRKASTYFIGLFTRTTKWWAQYHT